MKYIDQLNLENKRVFIRADLNVPFDKNGNITDDTRIRATLETLEYAIAKGAKIVLASHLGRPKGQFNPEYSLAPVAKHLSLLLKRNVIMAKDVIGDEVEKLAASLNPGQVLLLENLRFYAEEEENDAEFSKKLASLCDVYVDDAFGTAHRAHASTAGICSYIKEKGAGFIIKKELKSFEEAFDKPARPLVCIFGGAKVSTKIAAIKNVGKRADAIIVGGAMANTFFAADGLEVGKSLYEPELLELARETKKLLAESKCALHLPSDVVVAEKFEAGAKTKIVPSSEIPANSMALDIGPESVKAFSKVLGSAGTIVWNGPMGAFEIDEFSAGTYGIVDTLCELKNYRIVGGGDTDYALHKRHAFEKMSYVSTAGGAFLTLLEGKKLPAIEALG